MNSELREHRSNQIRAVWSKIPNWERVAMKHAMETHVGPDTPSFDAALAAMDDEAFEIFWNDIADNYMRDNKES